MDLSKGKTQSLLPPKPAYFFAEILREKRLLKRMTQRDAAIALGTSQSQWAYYEMGIRIPRLDVALKMAEILDFELKGLKFYPIEPGQRRWGMNEVRAIIAQKPKSQRRAKCMRVKRDDLYFLGLKEGEQHENCND